MNQKDDNTNKKAPWRQALSWAGAGLYLLGEFFVTQLIGRFLFKPFRAFYEKLDKVQPTKSFFDFIKSIRSPYGVAACLLIPSLLVNGGKIFFIFIALSHPLLAAGGILMLEGLGILTSGKILDVGRPVLRQNTQLRWVDDQLCRLHEWALTHITSPMETLKKLTGPLLLIIGKIRDAWRSGMARLRTLLSSK